MGHRPPAAARRIPPGRVSRRGRFGTANGRREHIGFDIPPRLVYKYSPQVELQAELLNRSRVLE